MLAFFGGSSMGSQECIFQWTQQFLWIVVTILLNFPLRPFFLVRVSLHSNLISNQMLSGQIESAFFIDFIVFCKYLLLFCLLLFICVFKTLYFSLNRCVFLTNSLNQNSSTFTVFDLRQILQEIFFSLLAKASFLVSVSPHQSIVISSHELFGIGANQRLTKI